MMRYLYICDKCIAKCDGGQAGKSTQKNQQTLTLIHHPEERHSFCIFPYFYFRLVLKADFFPVSYLLLIPPHFKCRISAIIIYMRQTHETTKNEKRKMNQVNSYIFSRLALIFHGTF